MNAQIKKGGLELCVLTLLSRNDMYGYEAAAALSKVADVAEGTLYPLLKRLRDERLVTTYLKESREGPPRKYYSLTTLGRERKDALRADWNAFSAAMSKILEEDENLTERDEVR